MACAPSEDSDQPGHPPSLALSDQSSLCAHWVAKDPSCLHADSEDSDQTGQMPRLIWVLAGRTCHFVGFVMRRLIWFRFKTSPKHLLSASKITLRIFFCRFSSCWVSIWHLLIACDIKKFVTNIGKVWKCKQFSKCSHKAVLSDLRL